MKDEKLDEEDQNGTIQSHARHYQDVHWLLRALLYWSEMLLKVQCYKASSLMQNYCNSGPNQHFNELWIISGANAVVQPRAVMIKVLDTAIASLAMLGILKNVCFAHIAIVIVLFYIEAHSIIALNLGLSFLIYCLISWINYCCLIWIFYYKDKKDHIYASKSSCNRYSFDTNTTNGWDENCIEYCYIVEKDEIGQDLLRMHGASEAMSFLRFLFC